ncbi:MAG: XRE family transcriptional regulator [Bdellovibrio sp.]|nr:XRE family transcriptional regulator [Bdellovibrio sp.]
MKKKSTHKNIKPVLSKDSYDIADALNLSKAVTLEWQVRHEVTEEIVKIFAHQNLTVTELAKRAKTSRARITRILKKDTSDMSLDVLLRVLGVTGQKIEIRFLKAS